MIPTYVFGWPSGKETGMYLAVDLGEFHLYFYAPSPKCGGTVFMKMVPESNPLSPTRRRRASLPTFALHLLLFRGRYLLVCIPCTAVTSRR